MYAGGEFLATFFAANGSNFATAGNWSGPSAALIAANTSGAATHNTNFDFAKLTFATVKGWTYSQARQITAKIQVEKSGEKSQNAGNVLQMGLNLSTGNLFGGEDFQIIGSEFWMPQRFTAAQKDQGLIVLQTSTMWSKNTFRTQVADDSGVLGEVIDYSPSPTGKALLWVGLDSIPTTPLTLNITNITSYDADGFPNWGSTTSIEGRGFLASGTNTPYPHPTLTLNDMPVILMGRYPEASTSGNVIVNTGTLAAPDYAAFLRTDAINTVLRSIQHIRYDSQGRAYFAHRAPNSPNPLGTGVARLTYTGANNNQTDLLNASNWTYEEIGFQPTIGAPANGTGATAIFQGRGITVDETDLVNGEPTIYMSDRTGHVIFRIRANTPNPTGGADWDFTIVVGQSATAGSTEGIGTAALLNQPCGLRIFEGNLYCIEKQGSKVRKIELPSLQTSTFFGVDLVRAHVDQFSF